MRYTTDTDYPFDTDNRAWRRFTDVAGEHFDIVGWTKDDGRPVLTTLIDLTSGDAFTIAILDSVEVRQPHALLAFTLAGDLSAHGPFDGEPAAASHAPRLAMTDPAVAATRPVPLHQPDQPTLPDDAWFAVPDPLARVARPALADTRTTVLVLVDRTRAVLAARRPVPHPRHRRGVAAYTRSRPRHPPGRRPAHRAAAPGTDRPGPAIAVQPTRAGGPAMDPAPERYPMTYPTQLRHIRWIVRLALTLGVAASVAANVLHARDNAISQTIAA